MPWIKNMGTKYHTQDTSYYCGGACAMMVLAEIGVGYGSLDQDDLYNSNHSHNVVAGWASDPEGVRFTMVDRKPAAFGNTFVVYRQASEAGGSQKLVYTLEHYGVSPIVLVYGCAHWIVVCGVQTDVNPATGPYTIQGFWVNNPVHEANEPHAAGDICGSGGSHGIENQWVSYATWQSTYFTGCAYDSADGSAQFISVCDPDVPKIAVPRRVEPVRYFDGRQYRRRAENRGRHRQGGRAAVASPDEADTARCAREVRHTATRAAARRRSQLLLPGAGERWRESDRLRAGGCPLRYASRVFTR